MGPWDRLTFEVTLTLPASDPLVINNFEADLPNMSYTIEDLQTFFQTLSLKGSNAPIHAEVWTDHFSFLPPVHTTHM